MAEVQNGRKICVVQGREKGSEIESENRKTQGG